ncbi:hypothetical protein AB1Y20_003081 [Prymnesium parvum]|uniref:Uncharacterized protein n=1 Tax=Prymnesium parvum TaxID=97485 RepID=A0AB34JB66_PRYPA
MFRLAGLAALAGRRALVPVATIGAAFSAAGWFGCFEVCFSIAKLALPVPAKQEESARISGMLSIPCVVGAAGAFGWVTAPKLAATPLSGDAAAWSAFMRSLPLKHWIGVGVGSAAAAAVSCRAIQYRGGA